MKWTLATEAYMKLKPTQSFKESGFITRPSSAYLKAATHPKLRSLSQNSLGYVSKCHNMEQKKDNTKHVVGSPKTAKVTAYK